jgi:hypothetical protein
MGGTGLSWGQCATRDRDHEPSVARDFASLVLAAGSGGGFAAVAPSHYVVGGANGGYLWLMVNDTCLSDNAGSVTMQITVP